jgi:multidrug efflux system membrane fusion protein
MHIRSAYSETSHRRPLRLRAAASLLMLAAAVACSRAQAQPAAPPPPRVTVATVVEQPVTEWDEFTGRLEAVDTVAIRPRVSGYIAKVTFDEGAVVKKGDTLFEIDARPFQAEVDRLRAERSRAEAVIDRAESELQRAERLRAENAMSREECVRAGSQGTGRSRIGGDCRRGVESRVHASNGADQRSRRTRDCD